MQTPIYLPASQAGFRIKGSQLCWHHLCNETDLFDGHADRHEIPLLVPGSISGLWHTLKRNGPGVSYGSNWSWWRYITVGPHPTNWYQSVCQNWRHEWPVLPVNSWGPTRRQLQPNSSHHHFWNGQQDMRPMFPPIPTFDLQLSLISEMQYADIDFVSTGQDYLKKVMDVLDTELPPWQLHCNRNKTQRVHMSK